MTTRPEYPDLMPGYRWQDIYVGGISIRAAIGGAGPPLLLLALPASDIALLSDMLDDGAGQLTIDLEQERIEIADRTIRFAVDPAVRQALMLGLDRIGETLTHADRIRAFEQAYLADNPWLGGSSAG